MPSVEKSNWLIENGFVITARDPRVNTAFKGRFMVIAEEDLQRLNGTCEDASDPYWILVGDDLEKIIGVSYTMFFYEPTLDEVRDKFKAQPGLDAARVYRATAMEYYDDGIISDATYDAIIRETQPYLEVEEC